MCCDFFLYASVFGPKHSTPVSNAAMPRYCYFCVMDVFFTEYLTEAEVATTKAVAKDCPCDFTPGSPHEPLSPVSSMQLPKFKSLSVEKKKKAAAKAEAAKAAAEAEAA